MYSFLTVNNQVSLISVTIAPSTWIATFTLLCVFLALYLPHLLPFFPRFSIPAFLRPSHIYKAITQLPEDEGTGLEKPLPGTPYADQHHHRLVLDDQSVFLADPLLYTQYTASSRQAHASSSPSYNSPRSSRRLPAPGGSSTLTDSPSLRDEESLHDLDLDPEEEVLEEEEEEEGMSEDQEQEPLSERGSGDGFCPPAWRREGSAGAAGTSSSNGFWRPPPRDDFGLHLPSYVQTPFARLDDPMLMAGKREVVREEPSEEEEEKEDGILEQASRTRLPFSPEKEMVKESSPLPTSKSDVSAHEENRTLQDNYIRFGIRAEVQHRTEPIETVIAFLRTIYRALTRTYTSLFTTLLLLLLAVATLRALLRPAPPRPTYDLLKVAGLARSLEPLIYYSENAVVQVHDLQATSLAVWDLGESVRTSGLDGGEGIVADLNALSDAMKTLGLEMTRFFTRVDGDIDGILDVMNWSKKRLEALQRSRSHNPFSVLYDNLHALLDPPFSPSSGPQQQSPNNPLAVIFGPSAPQREHRAIRSLFTDLLATLEEAITAELHQAVTLFALFEAVDAQFANLARAVARERSAQEEREEELLSGLWVAILGASARDLRKFEKNRALLRDVRAKTVRNKGILLDHNGKLLTLKASLEGLRARLVSPLVRGERAAEVSLEEQVEGLADVAGYLAGVRERQKGRVMESLFASVPSQRIMLEQGQPLMQMGQMA